MFAVKKNGRHPWILFRFHDDRIENLYFGCKPRIARFTEVAVYKPCFWSKDPVKKLATDVLPNGYPGN